MLAFVTGTSRYTAEPLLGGIAGTDQTVARIRSLVDEAWKTLDVRRLAVQILREAGAGQYDDWGKISAVYNWVRNHFYFVNDPVGKEVLMPFMDLVDLGAGDCDEINAIAMSVLLGAIGYEPRLVTVAADANDPTQFSHIYTEVFLNGNWLPMDAARPGAQMGVAPPSFFQREWWSLTEDHHEPYPGSGQLGQYRPMLTGLAGYGGRVFLGQDETVDLSNLPLTPPSDIGPSLETLPPGIIDTSGSSGGFLQSVENVFSGVGSFIGKVASPVTSLVKNAIGPGGQTHVQPTKAVATTGGLNLGGINLNTLLIAGLVIFGGAMFVGAMRKK